MASYVEDIVQNIYTKCDSSGLDKLNEGLQNAVLYSGNLEQSLKQLHQAQKMGIDFHARNVDAQKELLLTEKQKIQVLEAETKSRIRLADYEDKYARKKKRRDDEEIRRMQRRNGLQRGFMRLLGVYFGINTLRNIFNTGQAVQLLQQSIQGLTKSGQDWEFVNEQAFKFGVSLETVESSAPATSPCESAPAVT